MFLVEGLLAVAVGIWAFFDPTHRPEQMVADYQREALVETIDAEDTAKEEGHGPRGRWPLSATGGRDFALIYFYLQSRSTV